MQLSYSTCYGNDFATRHSLLSLWFVDGIDGTRKQWQPNASTHATLETRNTKFDNPEAKGSPLETSPARLGESTHASSGLQCSIPAGFGTDTYQTVWNPCRSVLLTEIKIQSSS
jgi:hypothetical protein